jgi:hypothetical protein
MNIKWTYDNEILTGHWGTIYISERCVGTVEERAIIQVRIEQRLLSIREKAVEAK